jgi:hypothetical protein
MIKYNIFAYTEASQGARELQQSLGRDRLECMRINYGSARYRRILGNEPPRDQHVLAFWGNVSRDRATNNERNILILNDVDKTIYTNKGAFFDTFARADSLILPPYTRHLDEASRMMTDYDNNWRPVLVERQVLTGHSGVGILLLKSGDQPTRNGRLWTKYIPMSTASTSSVVSTST